MEKRLTPARIALLYAAFASLWIFASDKILALTVPDRDWLMRISTYKGLAFVLITSWLLYQLIKTLVSKFVSADDRGTATSRLSRPGNLLAIFLGMALIVPLFGYVIARVSTPQIQRAAFDDLAAIAALKAGQIESWLGERHGDAEMLAANYSFVEQVEQWRRSGDLIAKRNVVNSLDSFKSVFSYDVTLLDTNGHPMRVGKAGTRTEEIWLTLLPIALRTGQVQMTNLHRDRDGQISIDFVVPLRLPNPQRAIGAVVLRAPAEEFLFPLIQSWPTASPSAESVLVRRDGDQLLYLNELRHRKGAALSLHLPLDTPDLVAAASVRSSKPMTMEGLDYRGIAILAAARPIQGTDWHLVAKVDRDEVMALLNEMLRWVVLVAIITVMVVASAVLMLWRQQQHMHQLALVARTAEKDKQLKLFYDLPFIGMAITSPDSKAWLYANDHLCKMLGYSREELQQTTWADITHPDDLDSDVADFERMKAGRIDGYKLEKRFLRKDGSPLTVNLDVKCTRSADGKVDHIVAMIEDITERKNAESLLLKNEQALLEAQEIGGFGSYDYDIANDRWTSSLVMDRIFGIDTAYLRNATGWADLIHPSERKEMLAYLGDIIERHFPFNREYRIIRPCDGEERWVLGLGKVTYDSDGMPLRMTGTIQDITERKRIEISLHESETTFRSLFDNMLNGVAHCRMIIRDGIPVDYEYIAVNPGFETITGLKDVEGKRVSEVIPGYCENNKESLQIFGKAAQTGEPVRWEHYLAALDKWFTFAIYSPVRGEFVVVLDNVTERKKTELALRESEDRFRSIFANAIDGILLADASTKKFVMANAAMTRMLGYGDDELLHLGLKDIHPGEDFKHNLELFEKMVRGEISIITNAETKRKDGTLFYVDIKASTLIIGGKTYLMGIFRDVTERKNTEDALRQSAAVFESSHDGIMITNVNGDILAVNSSFLKITGYSEAEVLRRNPRMLHSGRQSRDFYQTMWTSIREVGYWHGELWNRRKSGEIYPEWLTISAVKNAEGQTTNYVGTFSDLSQAKQSEEQVEHLAHYDPLTDLPNRLLVRSHLTQVLVRAQRHPRQIGVLYLDLDRFKNINDSLGYPVGDELLVAFTERLTMHMRSEDMLARMGGDEFLLVLENIQAAEDAAIVARSLLELLTQPFVLSGEQEIFIGASIGISVFPNDGDNADQLIQYADAAMHQAKQQGRNNYLFYTDSLTRASGEHLELETRLRHALQTDQLRVYFQPQVDIATGRIIGAEALVRWQDPERGLIPPVNFIPLAEETGLIDAIGEWVLTETCRQGKRWIESGLPFMTLAVNLSPHQFRRGNLVDVITRVLQETGFSPDRLELELTESALMEHEEEAVKMLHLLRALNIRLAIDDFGTGYSSLSYLKRFPLDILKIDKSFVDDIPFHQDDMEIAATIIAMGHTLGFKVLAEGVETAEQLDFLKTKGCDMFQGYLTSPPVPAEEFEALLRKR